ncbi:MAG TPA: methylated-DNA--[protein]-cysteine S-methyltransferase [Candidatus Limnocylindria bacterium]|nr:methylated-DNA--[protein]-cysteine S-methyltransferase [Candidatus Limnocylindria bacterium]
MIETTSLATPVGTLHLGVRSGRLCLLELSDERRFRRRLARSGEPTEPARSPAARDIADALRRYFAGDLQALDAIDADPLGGTPFQRRVWQALRSIPVGTTVSYATLARRIEAPKAVRAVGAANGANPVPIVLPCHRVIGADGSLTGYGGGLPTKRWLLAHEGVALPAR